MKYVVILKCPKRMLEYDFSKGFTILEYNVKNLAKPPNDVKKKNSRRRNRYVDRYMETKVLIEYWVLELKIC